MPHRSPNALAYSSSAVQVVRGLVGQCRLWQRATDEDTAAAVSDRKEVQLAAQEA